MSGIGITACDIELIGSNQVPIPGTSSETFTKELTKCGSIETTEDKIAIKVLGDIYFSDDNGSLAILRPSNKLTISVLIQFPAPIGEQYIKFEISPKVYLTQISWARSYIRRDCDSNVWKLCRKQIPSLPKDIKKSPVLVFNKGKWIIKPKKINEPARHKLLDLLGDLTTLGYPIIADITVIRPGHEFNRRLVNYLDGLISTTKS